MNPCKQLVLETVMGIVLVAAAAAAEEFPPMHVLETPAGTRVGIFGEKPDSPAPTLFVFALDLEGMERERIYSRTGRLLGPDGWLHVTVEIPCHGRDRRAGEPEYLRGWAQRIMQGEDFLAPFVRNCSDALDYLIEQGYTDPDRVAASGTSRGGFCALQFAAAEPRVRAVAGISPVTSLMALREFESADPKKVGKFSVSESATQLAGRPIWIGIGNQDERVSTADCVATAQALIAATRARFSERKRIPIELILAASDGHQAIDDAYELAADFIRQQVP